MAMSRRSVNLTTLFLGKLRPPKRLAGTQWPCFCQQMTTALLESMEGWGCAGGGGGGGGERMGEWP